jgi:hypothetical protein
MSLFPLIILFYLSFSTQTLSILGITPYLMSLYPSSSISLLHSNTEYFRYYSLPHVPLPSDHPLLSLLLHSNTEYCRYYSLPHVPLPSDHPLISLLSTQTLSILGITPYLMSLYPLIILFYLSSPLKH